MNRYTCLLLSVVVSIYVARNPVAAQLHLDVSKSHETTFTCVCSQGDSSTGHSTQKWDTSIRSRRGTSTIFFALNGTTLSSHNSLGLPQYSEWDFEHGAVAQFTLQTTTPFYGVFQCKGNVTGHFSSSDFALVYVPVHFFPSEYSHVLVNALIITCSVLFILLLVFSGVSLIYCVAKCSKRTRKSYLFDQNQSQDCHSNRTKTSTRYQGHFNVSRLFCNGLSHEGSHVLIDRRTGQKTETLKDVKGKVTNQTGDCTRTHTQMEHVSYVDPPEDIKFDSNGGRYINEDHEVELRVPRLAVPPGTVVTVRIGISLNTPLHFPNGMMPVSPIVHICVIDNPNFRFSKPVKVVIPHFLTINQPDVNSATGLQFIKANHGQFVFSTADGETQFEVGKSYGTLLTDHFCHICIASKIASLSRANFRLIRVIPRSLSPTWNAHFCVTYFLRTCLRSVEKQFDARDYEVQSLKRFSFSDSTSNGSIEIHFERKLAGGWNLTQAGCSSKVSASDVDFWRIDEGDLEQMEEERLYPPRFVIGVSGRHATEARNITINFTGAREDLQTELFLEPIVPQAPSDVNYVRMPRSYSDNMTELQRRQDYTRIQRHGLDFPLHMTRGYACEENRSGSIQDSAESLTDQPSHIDLMNQIAAHVPTKWRSVGMQLGISISKLDQIEQDHPYDSNRRFSEVFRHWERQPLNVMPYEWSSVLEALSSRQVSENKLASNVSLLLSRTTSISSLASV